MSGFSSADDCLPAEEFEEQKLDGVNTAKQDAMFETPKGKTAGNFHDFYLELGQWPDLSYEKHAEVSKKYETVKARYWNNKKEIRRLRKEVEKTDDCQQCDELKKDNANVKEALKEAVELSNLMLSQLNAINAQTSSK